LRILFDLQRCIVVIETLKGKINKKSDDLRATVVIYIDRDPHHFGTHSRSSLIINRASLQKMWDAYCINGTTRHRGYEDGRVEPLNYYTIHSILSGISTVLKNGEKLADVVNKNDYGVNDGDNNSIKLDAADDSDEE